MATLAENKEKLLALKAELAALNEQLAAGEDCNEIAEQMGKKADELKEILASINAEETTKIAEEAAAQVLAVATAAKKQAEEKLAADRAAAAKE